MAGRRKNTDRGTQGVFLRGDIYHIAYALPDGTIKRESSKSKNKTDAVKLYQKRKFEVAERKYQGQSKRMPIAVFLDDYFIPTYQNQRQWETSRKYHVQIIKNTFGKILLSDFTPQLLLKWKAEQRKTIKASSFNRKLVTLRLVFQLARKHKFITPEHLAELLETKTEPENKDRVRFLSNDELLRLMEVMQNKDAELLQMFVVSINTGLRKGNVFGLKWQWVDFDNQVIIVPAEAYKTKKPFVCHLNDAVMEVLKERLSVKNDKIPYVFYRPQTSDCWKSKQNVWTRIRKIAKVDDFHWHDLRHTFASYLVLRGVNLRTVQELCGHSNIKMTTRYAHLNDEIRKSAVETLNIKIENTQKNAQC